MTEQPVETMSEQAFLGNVEVGAVEFVALPEIPTQHYAPGAHRLPVAKLVPPVEIEVVRLFDAVVTAEENLNAAKEKSETAEQALKDALAEEHRLEGIHSRAQMALLSHASLGAKG
ncbi:hypothetical protein V1638_04125 [Pseudarthrobacter sp. J64]|uniref:hypothetical protein n=1 Tax=Pseudarthrobacter sp. J64 TaxID=3116485 RepID=UPI002E80B7DA|nr:hypothetical protein [Pseudarthrobacter sp. J64]MEE2568584.1 hypothetical protein [Pseudarthrobacter sp. J64]